MYSDNIASSVNAIKSRNPKAKQTMRPENHIMSHFAHKPPLSFSFSPTVLCGGPGCDVDDGTVVDVGCVIAVVVLFCVCEERPVVPAVEVVAGSYCVVAAVVVAAAAVPAPAPAVGSWANFCDPAAAAVPIQGVRKELDTFDE